MEPSQCDNSKIEGEVVEMASQEVSSLAFAAAATHKSIQRAFLSNQLDVLEKKHVSAIALGFLPTELREEVEFNGDNWEPDNIGRYPDLSSSISLVRRNGARDIVSCAIAPARDVWQHQALIAKRGEGVFLLTADGLVQIRRVNSCLQDWLPVEAVMFSKKQSEQWAEIGHVIAKLNGLGIRTQNDNGPYYVLKEFFTVCQDGVITPNNVASIEPYLVKPKDMVTAWLINCLNESLPEAERFVLTDMAGRPVFINGSYRQEEGVGVYQGSAFVAIPFAKSHRLFMNYLWQAVRDVASFDHPENTKMADLAAKLKEWQ